MAVAGLDWLSVWIGRLAMDERHVRPRILEWLYALRGTDLDSPPGSKLFDL